VASRQENPSGLLDGRRWRLKSPDAAGLAATTYVGLNPSTQHLRELHAEMHVEEVRECLGLRGSRRLNGWRFVDGQLRETDCPMSQWR
jgi:hypothetical protein